MANTQFFQFRYSKERMVVDLYCKVSIGAAGAPTLVSGSAKGIASIARNSAGVYTITLSDIYNRLLNLSGNFIAASGAAAPIVEVIAESVSSAKTIQIQATDVAGAATDPASGETMMLTISLANVA